MTVVWIIVGVLVGVLILGGIGAFFAVQKVRESAARMKDSNNGKQIAIAMHSYHDSNGQLPPAQDKVSWRVHLLPYVEQDNIYRRMDVKESWDSPTNKPFASYTIPVYASTADPPGTTETRYRVFVGKDTLFVPGEKPMRLTQIPDGVSNTIFAVEAAELVPWPQPKELLYDRNGPLPTLGAPGRKGFLVVMADGSVRFVTNDVSPDVIRGGIEPTDNRFFNP